MDRSLPYVCIITSARLFEVSIGGEGRFTKLLSKWLVSHGYGVAVMGSTYMGVKSKNVAGDLPEKDPNDEQTKVKVLNPPYLVYALSRLFISARAIFEIIRLRKENHYQAFVIHAQDTGYSGLAAVVSGKLLGVPVVVSSHGIRHRTLATRLDGRLNRLLLRLEIRLDEFTAKNSTYLIAVSPYIKEYFEKVLGRSKRKTRVTIAEIPIPVDTSLFKYSSSDRIRIRHEFSIDDDAIVFAFIGRLVRTKNLGSLIAAFSRVYKKFGPQVTLLIVGTGDQEDTLKELVNHHGIGKRVIFTGLRTDSATILSAIDIFVLPSLTEGLSTALLEAMAARRAVICSDIPGNVYVVQDRETGLLIDPFNIQSISNAMILLAENAALRDKLATAAQHQLSKFGIEEIFNRIVQVYYQALVTRNKH